MQETRRLQFDAPLLFLPLAKILPSFISWLELLWRAEYHLASLSKQETLQLLHRDTIKMPLPMLDITWATDDARKQVKRTASMPMLSPSDLVFNTAIGLSTDVLNELVKPTNPNQLTKIKEREEVLRKEELFGPKAERKRLGVCKFHMKKREQR